MAAANVAGEKWSVRNPKGLTTDECLDFICRLPADHIIVGYALGYDRTKWLESVPAKYLRVLIDDNSSDVVRFDEWQLSLTGSRFTVRPIGLRRHDYPLRKERHLNGKTDAKPCTVWDVFKFFQSKFTDALLAWGMATRDDLEMIERFKGKRGTFHMENPEEILAYSHAECQMLAGMMEKLRRAAHDADIPLATWYGAGSVAKAMLAKHGVKEHLSSGVPEPVAYAAAIAFSGGRFETSRIGRVPGPVYGYDIRSAYPDAMRTFPSLRSALWEKRRWKFGEIGMVHIRWDIPSGTWGPFFVRTDNGTILYPLKGEGWYWNCEVEEALRMYPDAITPIECWHLQPTDRTRPFAYLEDAYRLRQEWGKDGRGLCLKLGSNAHAGSMMQTVGKHPYQSAVYASWLTSHCRAKLLSAIRQNPAAIVQVATDGIFTTAPLELDCSEELGKWEPKVYAGGLFVVRPGVYFAADPSERGDKTIRGRGIGRGPMLVYADEIMARYDPNRPPETQSFTFPMRRFVGLKTGLRAKDTSRLGQWEESTIEISYNPMPKRLPDMSPLNAATIDRIMGGKKWVSNAYNPYIVSPETIAMRDAQRMLDDQPEADFAE